MPGLIDDRIARLLRETMAELDLSEIASELRIARVDALCAIRRLHDAGRVGRILRHGRRSQFGDHAPEAFVTRERTDLRFARNTTVVTPQDREARILRVDDDDIASFEYVDEPVLADRLGQCKVSLLRPFLPGRERPAPVRIQCAR